MQSFTAEDGCPAFRATAQLDDSQIGQTFRWGVSVGTPERPDVWGIASEINDAASTERNRTFTLRAAGQTERYYLTHLPAARGEQALYQWPAAAGDPLRRLGAERTQCRAGARHRQRRAVAGAATRVCR